MQLVVDNSAGELMPGAFANTRIELPANLRALSIPAGALIFGQKGLRVATVDANNKVVLKPITIARDLGQVVEIATGLAAHRPRHRQPARWPVGRRSGAGDREQEGGGALGPGRTPPTGGGRGSFGTWSPPFFRSSACRLRLPGTNGSRSFGAASPFLVRWSHRRTLPSCCGVL